MFTSELSNSGYTPELKFEHFHVGFNDPDFDESPEYTAWKALQDPELQNTVRIPNTSSLGKACQKSGPGFHPIIVRQHLAAYALNGFVPTTGVDFDVKTYTSGPHSSIGHEIKNMLGTRSAKTGKITYRASATGAFKSNSDRRERYPNGESQFVGSVPNLFIMLEPEHTAFGDKTFVALALGPLASQKYSQFLETEIEPMDLWLKLFKTSDPDPIKLMGEGKYQEIVRSVNPTPQLSVEQMSKFLRTIGFNGVPREDLGHAPTKVKPNGSLYEQEVISNTWTDIVKDNGIVILTGGESVSNETLLGKNSVERSAEKPTVCACGMLLPSSTNTTTCGYCY